MKSNKEILDELGQQIVERCYDDSIRNVDCFRNHPNPAIAWQEEAFFVKSLNDKQVDGLKKYISQNVNGVLFDLFDILDECPQYKLIFEQDGVQVDLKKISEMLKAEHMGPGGWIDRFSKYHYGSDERMSEE